MPTIQYINLTKREAVPTQILDPTENKATYWNGYLNNGLANYNAFDPNMTCSKADEID